MYDIHCSGCLGQAEPAEISPLPIPAVIPEFYDRLGQVWQTLDQKCRETLPESYCRQLLGYRPMVFRDKSENPGGLKWYWFVIFGFIGAKVLGKIR